MTAAKRRRRVRRNSAQLDATDLARIRTLYFVQGLTVEDIAIELEIANCSVEKAIRGMGEAPLAPDPSTHAHAWEPAPELGAARYRCACGGTGYRDTTSTIVSYRGPVLLSRDGPIKHSRQVPRTPNLDDYDEHDE